VIESIDIVFNEGIEAHKDHALKVFVGHEEKSPKKIKADLPERTHRWNFKYRDGLSIFSNDKLTIRPLHNRWSPGHVTLGHRDEIDKYEISAKDIISFCSSEPDSPPDGPEYYSLSCENSKITLKVFLRGFEALVCVDTTSLNPNAVLDDLNSLSSSKSLQECVSELHSVFNILNTNVEALENVTQVLENVASAHPITKAAVSALLIPYKLLMAEHGFKKNLQSLADEMQFLIKSVTDALRIAKLTSVKDSVMEIMKAVIEASHFVNEFVNKGRFSTFLPSPYCH